MVSLKVDNLTYRTSADDIEYLFEKYGKTGDVFSPKDKFTRESRGFAFVRFYDKRDAEDAMDALDGRMYDGRDLRIQMAKYGRPEPSERFGGGRGRSRSRGGKDRSRSKESRSRSRSRSAKKERSRSRSAKREKSSEKNRDKSKSRGSSASSRERSKSRS